MIPDLPAGTVCTNPFSWGEMHPDGSFFLCCPAWLKHPIGNLLRDDPRNIWNSPVAVEIRKTILNGTFHRCNPRRCPRLATRSKPVQQLDAVDDPLVHDALTRSLSTLPFGPRTLNLCFDLSCNLACTSCRDGIRTPTIEETTQGALIARRIHEHLLADVREIRLSGYGDPFASPIYRQFLRDLDPARLPALESIHLHTNGQLWTPERWQELAHLHPLVRSAEISIDAATEATYNRLRCGGSFSRLLDRLAFIAGLGLDLRLSFVVQRDNFREIPAFVELARRFGASVYLSQLVNWGTFSREEFLQRAVHLTGHPEHQELISILRPLADQPDVDLGNLSPLIRH